MNFRRSIGRGAGAFFHTAACTFVVAMLLSFPTSSVQRFDQRFRAVEFRHSIVRHTFMANPGQDGIQAAEQVQVAPATRIPPVAIDANPAPEARVELISDTPTIVVLQRFKLGPSRSGPTDPLI
jgi:hypothetical protein